MNSSKCITVFIERNESPMSQIHHELKKSCAKLLALMLMLSMITGVLGMSASADTADLEIKHKPLVTYYYGYNTGFNYRYNAFAVYLDDDTQYDLSCVESIISSAEFADGSTVSGSWTGKNYSYSKTAAGSDTVVKEYSGESSINAYTVIKNMNSIIITPNTFPDIVNESLMTKFSLGIVFQDGTILPVETNIERENFHVNFDGQNTTSEAMIINLAHCSSINNEDFYELDNAIFGEQALYDKTSNRYYADIDSKDNVKLPMDNMSGSAALVQTRIGENVVYNVNGAVDFENNALPAISQGGDFGRVFRMPDGTYASEEDVHTLLSFVSSNCDIFMYENKLYPKLSTEETMDPLITTNTSYIKKLGLDFIENGEMLSGIYTGLPQTNFDQNYIDDIVNSNPENYTLFKNGKITSDFKIFFDESSENNSYEIFSALEELAESPDTPNCVKRVLYPVAPELKPENDATPLYGSVIYKAKTGPETPRLITYPTNDLKTMINYMKTNNLGIRIANSIEFKYMSDGVNTIENADLAAEGIKKIADFLIKKFGVEIIDTKNTIILDLKNADRNVVMDFLHDHGVEEKVGAVNSVFEGGEYKYAKLGKFTDSNFLPQATTEKIVDDTFVNGNICVSMKDINIQKGVNYNVINQVQVINDFESEGLGVFDVYGNNRTMSVKGYTYYTRGELLTSAAVGCVSADNNDSSSSENPRSETYDSRLYVKVRNTEYKWGELAFASRPDSVTDLTVDENYLVSFTKPVDEGFGVTEDGKTIPDDYLRVNTYKIKLYDDEGNLVYRTTILRDEDKESVSIPRPLIEEGKNYKVVVIAVNPLGDSEPSEYNIFLGVPGIELDIKAKEDRVYYSDETVVFEETITNTSPVVLTNVVVTQDLFGEYEENDQINVKIGTSAQIPDLEPKQSFTLNYSVAASLAKDGKLIQKAEVNTAEQVCSSDICEVEVIVKEPETDTTDSANDTDNTDNTDSTGDSDNTDNTDSTGDSDNTDNTDSTGDSDNTDNTDSMGDSDNTDNSDNTDTTNDSENTDNTDNTDGIDDSDNTDNTDNTDSTNDSENTDNSDNTDSINDSDNTDNTDSLGDSDNTDNTDNTDSANDSDNTDNTDGANDSDNTDNTDDSANDSDNTDNTDSANDSDNTDNTDSSNDSDNTDNTDSTNDSDNTDNTDNTSDSDTDTDGDKEKDSDSDTDNGDSDTDSDNTDKDTNSDTDSNKKDTDDDTPDTDSDNGDSDSDVTDTDSSGKNDSYTDGKETIDSPDKADSDTDTGDEPDSDSDRILPYIMGDVNIDGKVTAKDSLILQRFIIKLESINNIQMFLGDVDQDNWLRTADCINILRYVIKLHTNTVTGQRVDVADSYVYKGTIG